RGVVRRGRLQHHPYQPPLPRPVHAAGTVAGSLPRGVARHRPLPQGGQARPLRGTVPRFEVVGSPAMVRRGWRRINDRLGRSAERGGEAVARRANGGSVLVIGAGVGGLLTAMSLARDGAAVTVVERDEVDASADLESAFATERRGAPQ